MYMESGLPALGSYQVGTEQVQGSLRELATCPRAQRHAGQALGWDVKLWFPWERSAWPGLQS